MARQRLDACRKVELLLDLERKHGRAIADIEDRLEALTDRVLVLEAREEGIIEKAKGAAGAAASAMLADVSRRVGALEERSKPPVALARKRRKTLPVE